MEQNCLCSAGFVESAGTNLADEGLFRVYRALFGIERRKTVRHGVMEARVADRRARYGREDTWCFPATPGLNTNWLLCLLAHCTAYEFHPGDAVRARCYRLYFAGEHYETGRSVFVSVFGKREQ